MTPDEATPKLHIDSDWKAQAQAEKERLAQQERQQAEKHEGQQGLPPANFQSLVSVLASQAIMGLGAMGDPKTGRVVVDLEGSRFSIDLLAVLDEKTKGNLSKEEAEELKQILAELRARYVRIAQLVAQDQAAGVGVGGGAAEPKPGPAPGSGLIVE
jgi:hypothetical protein